MTTKAPTPASIWSDPVHFLAFGCGLGAIPWAPGTFGTLLGFPVVFALHAMPFALATLTLFLLFLVGIWICGKTAEEIGVQDHSGIVFDEMVGFAIVMIALPLTWPWMVASFLLFRLFDIWKPWPIRQLDQTVEGGLGIMLDDIIAGVYAGLILLGIHYFLFITS